MRVTVQFYQATSNGAVSAADMEGFAAKIEKVYAQADYVGSLVTEGHTGRPTEYTGAGYMPDGTSWQDFPGLVERCYQRGAPCPAPAPRWGVLGE